MTPILASTLLRISGPFTGPNAPWRARSFLTAVGAMLVGSVLWINDAAKKPEAADENGVPVTASDLESVAARPAPPFPFRLGASYAGGFLFGWALRRFLKTTAWIAGTLVAAITLLKATGWVDLDWAAWQHHVSSNFTWIKSQAGGFKQFLFGFLPSAGAAGTGLFLGFRRS